jgi:fibronectin type 3 domain-containing protein
MKAFKVWSLVIIVLLLSSVVFTGCGPSVPAAPTGVTATPGNAQVTIAWTAVSDAASYNIYWSTTSGAATGGAQINGVAAGAATPSYTQQGLANGSTYYYVVTAVDENGGESAASAQVSAIPEASL